jgi:hypothetical protein
VLWGHHHGNTRRWPDGSAPAKRWLSDRGGVPAYCSRLTLAVPRVHSNVAFICIGIISGLPGAAVMSLPSRVLDVPTRAVGMGIFYSVYYGIMLVFPTAQGMLAQGTNSAAVTFDLAAMSLLGAIPLLAIFTALARRSARFVTVAA